MEMKLVPKWPKRKVTFVYYVKKHVSVFSDSNLLHLNSIFHLITILTVFYYFCFIFFLLQLKITDTLNNRLDLFLVLYISERFITICILSLTHRNFFGRWDFAWMLHHLALSFSATHKIDTFQWSKGIDITKFTLWFILPFFPVRWIYLA